jgi:hypothetical protein
MCLNLFRSKNNREKSDNEIIFPYKLYRGWYFPLIQFYIAKDLTSPPIAVSGLVDSGANLSIFNKETAEALGITMSKGKRRSFSGVASNSYGYEHTICFDVMGVKFRDEVLFSSKLGAYFNLIGRQSFFSQFQSIRFDENKRQTVLVRK